jgi:hypothetical protein
MNKEQGSPDCASHQELDAGTSWSAGSVACCSHDLLQQPFSSCGNDFRSKTEINFSQLSKYQFTSKEVQLMMY